MKAMFVLTSLLLAGLAIANNNLPVDRGCVVQNSNTIESCCNLGYGY